MTSRPPLPPPNPDLMGYSYGGDGSDGGWLKVAFDVACAVLLVLILIWGALLVFDLP